MYITESCLHTMRGKINCDITRNKQCKIVSCINSVFFIKCHNSGNVKERSNLGLI